MIFYHKNLNSYKFKRSHDPWPPTFATYASTSSVSIIMNIHYALQVEEGLKLATYLCNCKKSFNLATEVPQPLSS